MGFLRRLWHRLLFGSSPLSQPPRPAASPRPAAQPSRPGSARPAAASADVDAIAATIREWVKPHPPRCVYRSREEIELALLLPWLPDAERRRFLNLLLTRAGKQDPWTIDDVDEEPWQQVQQWADPLVITEPETMDSEDFCALLEAHIKIGLYTFCTPLEVLSRPVRMLWLWRQGRRAGQIYAAMEQALGRAQALDAAWWVVAGL
jgi:hypothetical protein